MSSSSKGRKSKMHRPGPKKNLSQNQSPGKKCQTKVRNGGTYEGIFHTFNPKMDVALNVVHKCDNADQTNGIDDQTSENDFPKEEGLIQEMIFPTENFVSASFEDVDLNFAVLDVNEANGELQSQQRTVTKSGEKKLEPWNGGGDSFDADVIGGLESSGLDGTNGWDANDMFRANEEKYGVVSNYDSSLSSYTMPLDIKETEEDSERVARATRLAQEIEGSNDYKNRIDLELDDGVTEEDKFSAVSRERDPRRDGRGPREMRDRDGEYGGHRGDKDRGDRDREHPISPQGYRNSKHDFDPRFRSRGRGRDAWNRNQGYPNPNMPPSRNMGSGGGPSGGGGRNQPPMSQMDGSPGQGGQGKPYRGAASGHLPPRFSKSVSGGHSRDEDRMRQTSDSSMHSSPYQAPKGQRPPRNMPRSNSGRWAPPSPSGEYPHHSPTQMHQDPAVISTGPSGGGMSLSRTSSSSSNTSAPVQNHRKHLSTSSQEEQQQHPSPHPQHMRQSQSSASPTGGPVIPNTQQSQSRPMQPPMPPSGPMQTGIGTTFKEAQPLPNAALDSSPGFRQEKPRTLICPKILKRHTKMPDEKSAVFPSPTKQPSPSLKSALKSTLSRKETLEKESTKTQRVRFAQKPLNAKRDLKFDQVLPEQGRFEDVSLVPEESSGPQSFDPVENLYASSQMSYMEHNIVPVHPVVPFLSPNQIQPYRLTVGPRCQTTYHHQHTAGLQYVIIHNPTAGVVPDASAIVQTQDAPGAPHSWASAVARGNQKGHMGPITPEMTQPHMGQVSPSALQQQSPGSNKIQFVSPLPVPPNVKLTWTPSPNTHYAQQGMTQPMSSNMGSPRVVHPNSHIQAAQLAMARAHQQQAQQPGVVTSPPQQQSMPTHSPMQTPQHQQHPAMQSMPSQGAQRIAQPPAKTQTTVSQEPVKQADKTEDLKPSTKKSGETPQLQPISVKARNEGQSSIQELQEFRHNFKLSTDINKDQTNVANKTQQRPSSNMLQQQPPPASRPQPPYPNPATQQQIYQQQQPQTQQHLSYPGTMAHPEHGAPMQYTMAQGPTQVPINQGMVPKPHPQHNIVTHMPHPQQMPHSQMTQQIPMASPGIQHFAAVPSPQTPILVSPRQMDSPKQMGGRMSQQVDKPTMPMQQKPIMSPKAEILSYNMNGNVHVVTGPPMAQTTPSAVISVSAAGPAPLVSSPYPSTITVNSQMGQQQMKRSPTPGQVASPSSTPSTEQSASTPSTTSITSPTAGKALNPEAIEFKPRTPAKPTVIATRAATPLQQQSYVAYQPQVIGGIGPQSSQLVTPVYSPGQVPQIDPMQASIPQMYSQFPQPFILGQQHMVQQISGQQMQQFATYDQTGQVYGGHTPQPMMAQNARMAALPSTPQQHIAQYPPDQNPAGTVYVPMAPQQTNFMQQARPHSAHTPTQVTHVTAASPAGQSSQQTQQLAGQPAPAMVQTPGQQQVWMSTAMMVQPGQIPQHHQQPPQLAAQYINAVPTQMPSSAGMPGPQPKGQQQAIQYMAQPPRQYAHQYPSPAQNNQ